MDQLCSGSNLLPAFHDPIDHQAPAGKPRRCHTLCQLPVCPKDKAWLVFQKTAAHGTIVAFQHPVQYLENVTEVSGKTAVPAIFIHLKKAPAVRVRHLRLIGHHRLVHIAGKQDHPIVQDPIIRI